MKFKNPLEFLWVILEKNLENIPSSNFQTTLQAGFWDTGPELRHPMIFVKTPTLARTPIFRSAVWMPDQIIESQNDRNKFDNKVLMSNSIFLIVSVKWLIIKGNLTSRLVGSKILRNCLYNDINSTSGYRKKLENAATFGHTLSCLKFLSDSASVYNS